MSQKLTKLQYKILMQRQPAPVALFRRVSKVSINNTNDEISKEIICHLKSNKSLA